MTSSVLSGITHAFSTRKGGVSVTPWDSLNLGLNLGDDPAAILEQAKAAILA